MTAVAKLTLPQVLPYAVAYLAKPGNEVGGALHSIFDDGNIDTDSIRYCQDLAIERGDTDGVALCGLLLRLSRTQRNKITHQARNPQALTGPVKVTGLIGYGACPTQWEGRTEDGQPVYVRYRHGHLSAQIDGAWVYSEQVGDPYDGVMDDATMYRQLRGVLRAA